MSATIITHQPTTYHCVYLMHTQQNDCLVTYLFVCYATIFQFEQPAMQYGHIDGMAVTNEDNGSHLNKIMVCYLLFGISLVILVFCTKSDDKLTATE